MLCIIFDILYNYKCIEKNIVVNFIMFRIDCFYCLLQVEVNLFLYIYLLFVLCYIIISNLLQDDKL